MTSRPATPVPLMVNHPAALEALVSDICTEEAYAFDTEFHTERTYVPDLALIQFAWADKVALVDPLSVDLSPLAEVFDGSGVAVAHAASGDLDVLQSACGSVPSRVFDTQIVAGFLGLSTPSLARLVDQFLSITLPKADRLSDWLVRPIPERQVSYAVNDVAHLLELRRILEDRLRALGRLDWALSECDQVLGDRSPTRTPEEAWWKLGDVRGMSTRTRGVAQEVAAWRERTAALTNRPRRSVLSDLGLLAISQRPPRTTDDLRRTRGVDGHHLAQGRAGEILAAVGRGLSLPSGAIRMPTEGRDAAVPAAAVAVCSGVVRYLADELDFDQSLLATRADLAQLLSGQPSRLDGGWRSTIVGDPLRRLLRGEVAVAIDRRGRLVLEPRPERRPLEND